MSYCFLGKRFRGFVLLVLEYCFAVSCSAADTHLKLLGHVVSSARFLTAGVFECELHIVDLWPYYVCCIRSCVSQCTLVIVLYLSRMCLVSTNAPPRCMTSQYRITFFLCQYLCRTNLVTPCSMVWDCRVSRVGPTPFQSIEMVW